MRGNPVSSPFSFRVFNDPYLRVKLSGEGLAIIGYMGSREQCVEHIMDPPLLKTSWDINSVRVVPKVL